MCLPNYIWTLRNGGLMLDFQSTKIWFVVPYLYWINKCSLPLFHRMLYIKFQISHMFYQDISKEKNCELIYIALISAYQFTVQVVIWQNSIFSLYSRVDVNHDIQFNAHLITCASAMEVHFVVEITGEIQIVSRTLAQYNPWPSECCNERI